MHEQPVLVAGVPGDQVDVPGRPGGHRPPRRDGQYLAVDHRRERRGGERDRSPAPEVIAGPHRVGGGGQPGRVGGPERLRGGGQPGPGGDRRGDVGGQRGREERTGHALRDGPAEQAGRVRHDQQGRDRAGPGRLAEDGHPVRVAAERGDVLPDPPQRRDLVQQPAVGRHAGQLGVALHADPVVEGDQDDVLLGQQRAVVAGQAGRARPVRAAVDPHHDRQSGRARVGREHVDGQPVVRVGARRGRGRRRRRVGGLRRRRAERLCVAGAVPGPRRARRREPQVARWRLGERDAQEDGDACCVPACCVPACRVPACWSAAAADQAAGGPDDGIGYVHVRTSCSTRASSRARFCPYGPVSPPGATLRHGVEQHGGNLSGRAG